MAQGRRGLDRISCRWVDLTNFLLALARPPILIYAIHLWCYHWRSWFVLFDDALWDKLFVLSIWALSEGFLRWVHHQLFLVSSSSWSIITRVSRVLQADGWFSVCCSLQWSTFNLCHSWLDVYGLFWWFKWHVLLYHHWLVWARSIGWALQSLRTDL